MSPMLLTAAILMLLAAALYSAAVWTSRRGLALRHILSFAGGLACDATGTYLMVAIRGRFVFNFHGAVGLAAFIIMGGHAVWAAVVYRARRPAWERRFHAASVWAWSLWMVAYVSGIVIGMGAPR